MISSKSFTILSRIYKLNTFHISSKYSTKMASEHFKLYSVFANEITDQLRKSLPETYEIECEPELKYSKYEYYIERVKGKHALIVFPLTPVDKAVLDAAGPQLKLIVTMSAGYEHIDLEECKKRNIAVGYARTAVTTATANLAIALAQMVMRKLYFCNNYVKDGTFHDYGHLNPLVRGCDLDGKTAGIVGLGDIGHAILKKLIALDVGKVLYSGNTRKPEGEKMGAKFVSFPELLEESDIVIVSCTLNNQTRKMFNKDAFLKMKKGAFFVNISRGAIADHDALYEVLSSGHLRGAGLDVTDPEPIPSDHPLTKLDNCVISPHIGGFCDTAFVKFFKTTVETLIAGLKGDPLPHQLC